ncbi:COX15/CtaA family protein [Peredibacter starrii]|uniref:COX15/CtaA family protein n=1 Tax=Peredibacter starrii TaxID=28202 RepID=A0AAX4HLN5_9BACT|nr:COX15/CtaA family protein [Peredibacter starrii]WPU63834.1 COX15/CtaA family protein [Peredibacter starrii]
MKGFQRLIFFSILGTYLVILAGAVVRGTGSGLGCPDWPHCFGQWVPPMDISELPANYKEVYKIAGKTIADFDPFKTWTEYINRLLGVILGILIVALFGQSFRVKNYERNLPWFCGGLLLLILVQGGVGALVVSTHLKPFIITIHMFLALVLLFGLLYLRKYCEDLQNTAIVQKIDRRALFITRILVASTFVQVLMGTQVRQQVDHFMRDTMEASAETIINFLGPTFYIHRTFSLVIIGLFIYLLAYFQRQRFQRGAFFLTLMAFFCVLGNVFTGVALNYFGFPANAQPPHLFFGVMSLGLLYSLSLNLRGTLLDD